MNANENFSTHIQREPLLWSMRTKNVWNFVNTLHTAVIMSTKKTLVMYAFFTLSLASFLYFRTTSTITKTSCYDDTVFNKYNTKEIALKTPNEYVQWTKWMRFMALRWNQNVVIEFLLKLEDFCLFSVTIHFVFTCSKNFKILTLSNTGQWRDNSYDEECKMKMKVWSGTQNVLEMYLTVSATAGYVIVVRNLKK